ncbi:hypothetical protein KPH14_001145 [Odynerus spinipes]|uniref:Uncharacterized protein n=1 Tax=Odynerus spinipes TaxID=1348599 RepID=A0AAD9RQ99_9HYME|nr:hypothetical protein KPH14_001145 [Odynerus spinipes]
MLESLVVLTIVNCFFMFSSTMTTCTLWWQYRNHRCVKEVSSRHTYPKSHAKKSKSSTSCHASKKTIKPKADDANKVLGTSKSFTNADERHETKDIEQRKSKNNLRYLAKYRKSNERRTDS